jgi:calcineurin-like phosphoesterase family protein
VIKIYWFISDTHFNHENIIEYCDRPFKSAEHMDREIIRRWNERVKPTDTVFHLGDFMFAKGGKRPQHYLKYLNGRVILIKGNHDGNNGLKTCIDSMTISLGGKNWWVQHRPEMLKWKYNLCGHVHNNWKVLDTERYIVVNLSVEVWDYYPVNIQEILKRLTKYLNRTKVS